MIPVLNSMLIYASLICLLHIARLFIRNLDINPTSIQLHVTLHIDASHCFDHHPVIGIPFAIVISASPWEPSSVDLSHRHFHLTAFDTKLALDFADHIHPTRLETLLEPSADPHTLFVTGLFLIRQPFRALSFRRI